MDVTGRRWAQRRRTRCSPRLLPLLPVCHLFPLTFRLHDILCVCGEEPCRLRRGLVFPAHPRFRKFGGAEPASSYKTILFALDYKMDGCDINIEGNLFDLSRPN